MVKNFWYCLIIYRITTQESFPLRHDHTSRKRRSMTQIVVTSVGLVPRKWTGGQTDRQAKKSIAVLYQAI